MVSESSEITLKEAMDGGSSSMKPVPETAKSSKKKLVDRVEV